MEPKDIYREALNNSYSEELEDKELEDKINSIDEIKDSPLTTVRDMAVDLTSGAVIGKALGSILGGIKNKGKNVIKSLSEGIDDATKDIAEKIVKKSSKQTSRLNRAMQENSHAAREAVRVGNAGKALPVIINNRILEAKIGPEYVDDIANILSKGTGKSTKDAKKAIENWLKKHADDTNLLSLIEAKDNTTFAHSTRVGELTKQVALEAGLGEEAAERLKQAAFLHDIGKIATPDRILSSTANIKHHPEIFEWLKAHPDLGYKILEGVDDTAAGIAKGHHPLYDTSIVPTKDTNIVTISDIYDAITDQGRNYRGGVIHDKDFALYDPNGIQWNIGKGETTWEYLELLRRLDEKGLLKEYYPVDSELTDAFNTLKANFLEDTVKKHYVNKAGNIGALAGGKVGGTLGLLNSDWGQKPPRLQDKGSTLSAFKNPTSDILKKAASDAFKNPDGGTSDIFNVDWSKVPGASGEEMYKQAREEEEGAAKARRQAKGGIEPSELPSGSEILSEIFPLYRSKSEKLADIMQWYENGYLNKEQIELIKSTDFKSNMEVTKLWKELKKTVY